MKYRFIEGITSDVMFEAYGKDLKELFSNAATALFEVICYTDKVSAKSKVVVEVEGDNPKELLVSWLQNLIAQVDIEGMFFSKFEIKQVSEKKLKAEIWGEPISSEKGKTVVKAVTYHQLDFKKTKEGYVVRVSLDI